jgi:hypothetical protein
MARPAAVVHERDRAGRSGGDHLLENLLQRGSRRGMALRFGGLAASAGIGLGGGAEREAAEQDRARGGEGVASCAFELEG